MERISSPLNREEPRDRLSALFTWLPLQLGQLDAIGLKPLQYGKYGIQEPVTS